MSTYPPFQIRNLPRTIEMQVPQKAVRDLINKLRFGLDAPQSDERIFIDPRQVTHQFKRFKGNQLRRRHSGLVLDSDWDLSTNPLETARKFRAVWDHFRNGVSWEDTGIIDSMMRSIKEQGVFDGCRTRQDVYERYDRMDKLYEAVRSTGQLQSVQERPEFFRREYDGIYVHIDRNGQPMLAGNGNHRLAIAKALELSVVPAQLGVIHLKAVENGHLDKLRRLPQG
ncbi:MAG: hypothetical protein ACRBB0_24620 [Pelagimonas sp.]|uniref:hypothetical protein n=1 Tax=Pelagimonas sp. TaxID=2073170 RepID=UPI003D6C45A8